MSEIMPSANDTRQRLRNLVLIGRDGVLFHRDGNAVEQVTATSLFNAAHLERWIATLETRQAWCDARGIVSRLLIVPEKHVVYSDKLPDGISISQDRPAKKIISAMGAMIGKNLLYPVEMLTQAREIEDTYFITDTHWNMFGAFLTYRSLMESLSRDRDFKALEKDEIVWVQRRHVGDLGVRLDPEQSEIAKMIERHTHGVPFKRVFDNKKFSRGAVQIYETHNSNLPRCVLFRDSFANYLVPQLIGSFSRLVVVSSISYQYDLLRSEQPDFVIMETAERFLAMTGRTDEIELPEDLSGPSFSELTGVDLRTLGAAKVGNTHDSR
jgi:alginate O-acetyltransferase complex protein AlgJ